MNLEELQRAEAQEVQMYLPPKPPRKADSQGSQYLPREDEPEELQRWRERMGSAGGQSLYKERAATVETANADLKSFRGLCQLTVRSLAKATCVALWSALAYNLMHFGQALLN